MEREGGRRRERESRQKGGGRKKKRESLDRRYQVYCTNNLFVKAYYGERKCVYREVETTALYHAASQSQHTNPSNTFFVHTPDMVFSSHTQSNHYGCSHRPILSTSCAMMQGLSRKC